MKKIEILAPAGSFESMAGAINAGADAVYMGGRLFGARAYADNPDDDRLLDAIDYVHLHGKKLYLTVNTLLKDQELEEGLYAYLKPLYERGLDAVIVQDMGVLTAIRRWFPDLDIHASTQMTVVSKDHARYLKALGVTRIVPARELSLEEVHRLKNTFGGEIECFVHGALCYCYSGQCLLSSMLGGRSGNRGRCAQPCRLPYGLGGPDGGAAGYKASRHSGDRQGKRSSGGSSGNDRAGNEQYLISPKDICTLDILPQLVACGIDSFKIEGRMKRPEYAAFVAYIYRKYTDMYLKYGKAGYHVDPADKQALMDLYNRGGFSEGYYKMHNGREMMSLQRPNHFGSYVGTVAGRACEKPARGNQPARGEKSVRGTQAARGEKPVWDTRPVGGEKPGFGSNRATVRIHANVPLNKGDVLVMDGFSDKESVTLTAGCESGGFAEVHFSKPVAPGTRVYRMRNEHLLEWIQKSFLNGENQEKIYISLTLFKDLPATMHLSWGQFEASVQGPVVTAAQKQPLTKRTVEEKISKMGNTPYRPEKIEISMDADAYLPLQALNQLRRDGVEALKAAVLGSYERRHTVDTKVPAGPSAVHASDEISKMAHGGSPQRRVLISSLSMAETVLGFSDISRIYMEPWLLDEPDVLRVAAQIRDSHRQVYLALPHIFRDDSRSRWESLYMELLETGAFDGYLVRNMEGLAFLEDHGLAAPGNDLVADYELYTMNRRSRDYYLNLGFSQTTVPLELNYRELRSHGCCNEEMIVYGYIPLMVSAQCVYKTAGGCQLRQTNGKGQQPAGAANGRNLVDRYGKALAVKNICADCYNLIYNSQPLVLYDMAKELKVLAPAAVRYVFTKESPEQIRMILSGGSCPEEQFTRGHFNRGVE